MHPRLIRIQALHPTLKARSDHELAGLVDLDRAAGTNDAGQWRSAYTLRAHAEGLCPVRWQDHRTGHGRLIRAFVDRDVVHPH